MKLSAIRIIVVLFVGSLCAMQLFAVDWVGGTGDFQNGINWSTGSVPSNGSEAVINNGGVAQQSTGNVGVATLRIASNGTGAFEQTGGDFFANGAFIGDSSDSGMVHISGGTFNIGGDSIHVGWQPSGVGQMAIDGPTAVVTSGDDFQLGREGSGTLNFDDGQLRAGYTVVGKFGVGIWNQSGGLFDQDFGDFEIGDGGRDDQAGTPGPRTGIVNLTGGFIQTASDFAIGNRRGTGIVSVRGGVISATGGSDSDIFIGKGADSSVGVGGETSLRVMGDDAIIVASGNLIMNPGNVSSSSVLIAEITGATHTPIVVGGNAEIGNGKLKVELAGYHPAANDSWELIRTGSDLSDELIQIDDQVDEAGFPQMIHTAPEFAGAIMGEFMDLDFSMAPLAPGLNWDVAYAPEQVFLVVSGTPTPSGDFDGNGSLDTVDIDALMNEVADGTNDGTFDLNGDSAVDDLDRDEWLSLAGPANGFVGALLLGDSDLNGTVDATDLNALAVAWQTDNNNWTNGNFAGSGTNVTDLNALGVNWVKTVPMGANVPEPASCMVGVVVAIAIGITRRKGSKHALGASFPRRI